MCNLGILLQFMQLPIFFVYIYIFIKSRQLLVHQNIVIYMSIFGSRESILITNNMNVKPFGSNVQLYIKMFVKEKMDKQVLHFMKNEYFITSQEVMANYYVLHIIFLLVIVIIVSCLLKYCTNDVEVICLCMQEYALCQTNW